MLIILFAIIFLPLALFLSLGLVTVILKTFFDGLVN